MNSYTLFVACATLLVSLTLAAFSCNAFIMGYGRPRTAAAAKRVDKRLFSLYGTASASPYASNSFDSIDPYYSPYQSGNFAVDASGYSDPSDALSFDAAARLSSAAAAAASQMRIEQQQQQALLGELLYAAATTSDGVRPADVAEAARRERQLRLAQRQRASQMLAAPAQQSDKASKV